MQLVLLQLNHKGIHVKKLKGTESVSTEDFTTIPLILLHL